MADAFAPEGGCLWFARCAVQQCREGLTVPGVLEEVDDEARESGAAFLCGAVEDAGDDRLRVEAQVDDLAEQALLRAEVVDDERRIDCRLGRDRPDRGLGVAVLAELPPRSGRYLRACAALTRSPALLGRW